MPGLHANIDSAPFAWYTYNIQGCNKEASASLVQDEHKTLSKPTSDNLSREVTTASYATLNSPRVDSALSKSQNTPPSINEPSAGARRRSTPSRTELRDVGWRKTTADLDFPNVLDLERVLTPTIRHSTDIAKPKRKRRAPRLSTAVVSCNDGDLTTSRSRRTGPLSDAARANARLRRKNKDTCINCRLTKRACDGDARCHACGIPLVDQPCVRACFATIVEHGACNYISQRAINYPTNNDSGPVRIGILPDIDILDVLDELNLRQGEFNIRVSHSSGPIFDTNTSYITAFLTGIVQSSANCRLDFLTFINHMIPDQMGSLDDWRSCIILDSLPESLNEVIDMLWQLIWKWNHMPSRFRYSLLPVNDKQPARGLSVDIGQDQPEIFLAAQLSRVICRMVEVEVFRRLERELYNIKWKHMMHERQLVFLSGLGHILFTFRWRLSWWRRFGDGTSRSDPLMKHCTDRVERLSQILYAYDSALRSRLPSWLKEAPTGGWSAHLHCKNKVWDEFPKDPSGEGFRAWIDRGAELITEADVMRPVAFL
ncbi:hypothetical protein BJX64DRAFT_288835 [Aspergillus heterothallicus]